MENKKEPKDIMDIKQGEINLPELPDSLDIEIGPIEQYSTELGAEGLAPRRFSGWAPPLTWGPWVHVASNGGRVTYDISYQPVGDTVVHALVNYHNGSEWVRTRFDNSIRITTGNVWATVYVCFAGNPLGSTVHGQINP